MHGDKSQGQRERALARFENGDVGTLIATDVAARGIDVADITHVINFDIPGDQDAYVHRIGRTGRAGRSGAGVSFVLADQVGEMRRIARDLGLAPQFDGARRARPRTATAVAAATATATAALQSRNGNDLHEKPQKGNGPSAKSSHKGSSPPAKKRRRRRRGSKVAA